MAIALRGTPTTANSSTSSLSINIPTGVVNADVLIFNVDVTGASSLPGTPSGLTLLDSASASGPSNATYYRVCNGTEPSSYTFSGAGGGFGVTCRAYSGVSNSAPINAHSAFNRLGGTTGTANGVTTTVNGCMLVYVSGANASGDTFTAPTGFGNTALANVTYPAASCDETQTTAGATGNVSGTWGTAGGIASQSSLIALAPSTGSAPVNTVAPSISGTLHVGQTLTTSNGTWTDDGSPSYSYQWQRDNSGGGVYSNITGSTSATYVLVATDDACNVRCVVTNSTPDGNTAANSGAVSITYAAPTNSVAPIVSGVATVGTVLSCDTGTWTI